MAYRFKRRESVDAGLVRIVREQIDNAIAELDGADGNAELSQAEVVHQVRKRCKKIRGAARLCRPELGKTYTRVNASFRDSARLLSGLRDADAMLEAFDGLMTRYAEDVDPQRFAEVRAFLESCRPAGSAGGLPIEQRLAEFRTRVVDARRQLDDWSIDADGFKAVSGGLEKTYGRGREAMDGARDEPSTENLHEWRKRVKYHWYHCRLLRDIWQDHMQQRCDALDELSDLLGDDHDLAVLRDTVVERGGPVAAHAGLDSFIELLDRRRAELQRDAFALGRLVFAEKPKQIRKRYKRYWKAWKDPIEAAAANDETPVQHVAGRATPAG